MQLSIIAAQNAKNPNRKKQNTTDAIKGIVPSAHNHLSLTNSTGTGGTMLIKQLLNFV